MALNVATSLANESEVAWPEYLDALLIYQSPGSTELLGPTSVRIIDESVALSQLSGRAYGIPHLKRWLEEEGATVFGHTRFSVHFRSSLDLLLRLTQTEIVQIKRETAKTPSKSEVAEYYEFRTADGNSANSAECVLSPFERWASFVCLENPSYFAAEIASALAPKFGRWHLQPPHDIQVALNAPPCHRMGVTGKGVKVAMVDSGVSRHPHFETQGYKTTWPRPRDAEDLVGHGTGEVANLYSIAPDCEVISVRKDIAQSAEGFRRALETDADIINCSWALQLTDTVFDTHRMLDLLIREAVERGVIVVCAAGNGFNGFPAQHPEVISVGAAFKAESGAVSLASYSSAFESAVYSGRTVPDLCGVAGSSLEAPFLHLPVPAGSEYDSRYSEFQNIIGDDVPLNDQIKSDGWAAFSGTSAAAPQVAGICALLLQAEPSLKPHEVKSILMRSADPVIDSVAGSTDNGAGAGLANALSALRELQ